MTDPTTSTSTTTSQNVRTRFVVAGMALLFVISWAMSLGRMFRTRFWSRRYNLENVYDQDPMGNVYNTSMSEIGASYYRKRRFIYFLPHILGAVFWWNLYFLQLIPQIRHRYKTFHRYLGRCLMVVALIQTTTGVGLAITTHSSIIKLVSICFAVAVYYCIYRAWRYAMHRDISMHKYWVYRLVGYLQTIALQRFWLLLLIASHQMGFNGLYPPLDDASQEVTDRVVFSIFDDSFVLSILTAVFVTEWYLAGMLDMMKAPIRSAAYRKENPVEDEQASEEQSHEERSCVPEGVSAPPP